MYIKLFQKQNKTKLLLIAILALTFLLRIYRIDYPKAAVFDEVYYPFTAEEYLKGNSEAWLWTGKAPEGHSIAWVNPPLAQEIMAGSMAIFRTNDLWAARIPGVILGTLCVFLVFYLGKLLFKDEKIALLSSFIFSIDGLNFVQSRTGMLDIYLVTFILLSVVFLIKKNIFLSAIFFGLALANKWTAMYLIGLILPVLIYQKQFHKLVVYLLVVPATYLLVYLPFFLTGHTTDQFWELLKQEWYYHTHLKATHNYASSWWSWPLNLYPVWYFVDYGGGKVSNIFASGNPILFWLGSGAVVLTYFEIIKSKLKVAPSVIITVAGFFVFWLPWAISPRLMFIYYFTPAIPFMCLLLGFQLNKLLQKREDKPLFFVIMGLLVLSFILIFPFLTGIPLPKNLVQFFFLTNLAKNPF
jgi:dolichyl-phosphate-mannose-protein mannosyltransferase